MEHESCNIRKAKILNKKLAEIMEKEPFKPLVKFDGVTGIIIIRLREDDEAQIMLLGHIAPVLAVECLVTVLNKGQQIAEAQRNPLAS